MMDTVQWYQPKVLMEFPISLNLPSIPPRKVNLSRQVCIKHRCVQSHWLSLRLRLQQRPALKPTSLASDLLRHEGEESPGRASIQVSRGWLQGAAPWWLHQGLPSRQAPITQAPLEHPWALCCSYHVVLSWERASQEPLSSGRISSTCVFLLSQDGRESAGTGRHPVLLRTKALGLSPLPGLTDICHLQAPWTE